MNHNVSGPAYDLQVRRPDKASPLEVGDKIFDTNWRVFNANWDSMPFPRCGEFSPAAETFELMDFKSVIALQSVIDAGLPGRFEFRIRTYHVESKVTWELTEEAANRLEPEQGLAIGGQR